MNRIPQFLRFLHKSSFYYLVNISGMSLSLAVTFLLVLFIYRELRTDRFHKDISNMYCVELDGKGYTPFVYADLLKDQLPGVTSITRVQLWDLKFNVLRYEDNPPLDLDKIIRADTNFFSFFTFSFIYGDPASCLNKPESLVLTESSARKLFGNEDPLGKTVSYNKGQILLTVTAVVKDPPFNSSLQFNAVMSVNSLPVIYPPYRQPGAFFWSFETFVSFEGKPDNKVNKLASEIFVRSIPSESMKEAQDIFKSKFEIRLIPYSKVYFNKNFQTSLGKGDIKQVYLFSIIGFLIVLVALINYINLSNAGATIRTKEVMIRKIMGSEKGNLFLRFLGESVLVCFVAVFFALVLGSILTSFVNRQQIFSSQLDYYSLGDQVVILLAGSIIIGIAGGIYPAIALASASASVSETHKVYSGSVLIRKILLFLQFFVSSCLLVSAIVMSRQYRCMTENPTGFDPADILCLRMGVQLKKNYNPFTERLKQVPGIESLANARYNFIGGRNPALAEFMCRGNQVKMDAISFSTDTGFMEILKLSITGGNSFREHDNLKNKLIINETALKQMGSQDLSEITLPDKVHGVTWQVVGVVKDFNTRSMQYPVSPYIFYFVPGDADMDGLYIKLRSGADLPETVDLIKKICLDFAPDEPVNPEFLEDAKARIYKEDMNRRKIFVFLSGLTILISCLGLYALSGFILERKTKETGIRKVFGADEKSLFVTLASGFMWIVVAGYCIALPVSWYLMSRWLQNFSLKTKLTIWIFLASGMVIFLVALLSILMEIRRTSSKNVIDIIRHE